MKKIVKWLGIAVAIVVLLFVLIIVFVPSSNKSFDAGRNTGKEAVQTEIASLGEEQKKSIYKEVVLAEDKGRLEAEEECPTDTTNDQLADKWSAMNEPEQEKYLRDCLKLKDQLSEQYRDEVLAKYNLTAENWKEISTQANNEQWPLE